MDETVLIYLIKDNKYLLIFRNKKKNDINKGKYIGIGGHIEKGETPDDAVKRETYEETSLTLNSFKYRGKLLFINDDYKEIIHLYTSSEFTGEITSNCNEGTLYWIDRNNLHNISMWEGDYKFIDLLENEADYFEMTLTYDGDKLVSAIRTK